MKMYVKGYLQRKNEISAVLAIIAVGLVLCYVLFHTLFSCAFFQIGTYDNADYEYIYILNYETGLKNECIYPGIDVVLYSDESRQHRIPVSSIMVNQNTEYDLSYSNILNKLAPGEIAISSSTAKAFCISAGDTLYAEYSYASQLFPLTVKYISAFDLEYEHPYIENNIGIAFLGYNDDYKSNTICRYLIYADSSKASDLSGFPQVIASVINKYELRDAVFNQLLIAYVFELVFSVGIVVLAQLLLFSKSQKYLFRCYLKGMKRWLIGGISFLERVFLLIVPCFIIQTFLFTGLPVNDASIIYFSMPEIVGMIYCLIYLLMDCKTLKKGR